MTEAREQAELVCEGPAAADEVTGYVQVDFLVRRRMGPATEFAILVNSPALDMLAEALGRERTGVFAETVTEALGRAWILRRLGELGRCEPITMICRATLESHPELIEAARTSFEAAA